MEELRYCPAGGNCVAATALGIACERLALLAVFTELVVSGAANLLAVQPANTVAKDKAPMTATEDFNALDRKRKLIRLLLLNTLQWI